MEPAAMSDPTFGLTFTTINDEPRPVVASNMSVVGLVFTAPDANEDIFPLDRCVPFYSDDKVKLAQMGKAGCGYDSVAAINLQLGEFQVAAQIVGVRVAEGATVTETIANLIGDINAKTGMWALLDAPSEHGLTPRLLLVGPGYTSQGMNRAGTFNVLTQGSGLTEAPTVTFTGGGNDAGKVLPAGTAVLGTGASAGKVISVTFTERGKNLSAPVTVEFTGGGSAGGKVLPTGSVTIDTASNAIVAALPTLLDGLLAHAVVDGPNSTQTAAINWRESISSKRIIPVDPAYKVLDDDGEVVVVPKSPYVVGIAVRRDHEFEGRPFHSWANQAVRGIVGTARPIGFSILDGANEGQTLLSHNIGITVRGERTDGAIADGGYVFIGTDTCSDDELWRFYNQTRGRDYIHLLFIKALRYYLGKHNLTGHAITSVLNTMKFALRDLQSQGDIIGFKVGFTGSTNSPELMRQGRFNVSFAAEEPAPLRHLGIQSARYRPALDTLLSDLLAQFDAAA
jgi:phage tail sheath protein FI